MQEREISLAEVQEVYESAEITYASKHGDSCLSKEINGRLIKIVVIQGTDRIKTVIDQKEDA